ncbi:MAG: rhomboid family intramembrane serine protease [Nitrospirae bacterium]|nr:rhomboid family intramembrane serine protease [Candidatus Manganitrophaceae bacterium]
MIPLKDDLLTHTTPVVTVALVAVNIIVFFYEVSLGAGADNFIFQYGAIPLNLVHGMDGGRQGLVAVSSVLTSMFLHGGFMHLAGNMLYLWIFGNNIEDVMGHVRFILFYLVCGVIAAYTHALTDPGSRIPMVGASGAISGVLGAYLVLFPHAKVLTLVPIGFFIQLIRIPAVLVLGIWFLVQFVSGIFGYSGIFGSQSGGIAWFAHIGGFLAGMVLIYPFKKKQRQRQGWY